MMIVKDNENILVCILEIEIEKTGHITNCYILKDKNTSKACVIDPAFNARLIQENIKEIGARLDKIIVTHSHADHIAALKDLVEENNVKVYVHHEDYEGLYNRVLNEEEVVKTVVKPVNEENVVKIKEQDNIFVGDTVLEVIHTPGHTKGSIVLYDDADSIMFSGDTIFENTYGRTDLIAGSHEDMGKTLDKLFTRFNDVQVFPGHNNIFNLEDSKRKIRLLYAYKG